MKRGLSYLLALIAVPLLLVVAACSSVAPSSSSSTPSSAQHNQQDVLFANQLIDLSLETINIADVLSGRTEDAQQQAVLEEITRQAEDRVGVGRGLLRSMGVERAEEPRAPDLLTEAQFDALIETSDAQLQQAIQVAATSQRNGFEAICNAEISGGSDPYAIEVAHGVLDQVETDYQKLTSMQLSVG